MALEHFEYTPTRAHFVDFVKAVSWRVSAAGKPSAAAKAVRLFAGAAIGVALFATFVTADKFCGIPGEPYWLEPWSVFIGAFAAFGVFWSLSAWLNLRNTRAMVEDGSAFLGPTRLTVLPDRLETFGRTIRSTYDWDAFQAVDTSGSIVVLWVDRGVGVFIPREVFSGPAAEDAFIATCRQRIAAARARAA